jgi:hypothetical protein
VPALNLAVCWEHFFIIKSQSAGNLFDLNLLEILREYTPEIICCKSSILLKSNYSGSATNSYDLLQINKTNKTNKNYASYGCYSYSSKEKFISYLTGLIEGDGTIIVPKNDRSSKGKLYYPSIQIVFHLKDLPLALLIQKNLRFGSLIRKKGVNAYILYFNSHEGILKLVKLLNGNMRTPKINSFYNLID